MKNKILFSFLVIFSLSLIYAEEVKLNVAVPIEKPATVDNSVEANLPRTDADFLKYKEYWSRQSVESIQKEIDVLQKYVIDTSAEARKSRMEYEKKCISFVPQNSSEKIDELRDKEKKLSAELAQVRKEIRNELLKSPELKELSEKNQRNNLNVRHARLALQALQKIKNENK
jgi:hypothetical protein